MRYNYDKILKREPQTYGAKIKEVSEEDLAENLKSYKDFLAKFGLPENENFDSENLDKIRLEDIEKIKKLALCEVEEIFFKLDPRDKKIREFQNKKTRKGPESGEEAIGTINTWLRELPEITKMTNTARPINTIPFKIKNIKIGEKNLIILIHPSGNPKQVFVIREL